MDIKVSLIIPVYNVEKYLTQCLDSVLAQTYTNLQIIIIDDGSTDNSGKIADEFAAKDKRINVIHKENEGVSIARNVGINFATGKYVCFSDADDYLMPDYVEYLLELAIKNNADISLTKEMFTTFHTSQVQKDRQEVYTAEQTTIDILSYNIPIGVYCKMFKRDLLGETIRFVPNIRIGEGFNFNTEAFQRAQRVAIGRKKIYFYRRDNMGSATTCYSFEKWENAIFAIDNIYKNLIIHSKKIEIAWNYAKWHTVCDAFNFMVIADAEKKYHTTYKKYKHIVRFKSYYIFKVKISLYERIKGLVYMFFPRIMPYLIKRRRK